MVLFPSGPGASLDEFPTSTCSYWSSAAVEDALSLAVVGALAAPFTFGTYKARPVSSVWVPLTAHDKEQRANYLDTNDCKSFDNNSSDELFCYYDLRTGEKDFKRRIQNELEWGTRRGEFTPTFSSIWR